MRIVKRGFLTKAKLSPDQSRELLAMQPSLRCAWNWICDLWDGHCRRCEDWALARGIVLPVPPKIDYARMSSDEAKAAKHNRRQQLSERRKTYMDAARNADDAPVFLPLTGNTSVATRCMEQGILSGKVHDYQILNEVLKDRGLPQLPAAYLQSLVKSHRTACGFAGKGNGLRGPKKRKSHEDMPIKFRTGGGFRWESGRDASICFPGVKGRIKVRIDPGTLSQLYCTGSRVLEGGTLKHEYGTWWFSALIEKVVPTRSIIGMRKASARSRHQDVLVDSGNGPGTGICIGIDPGLADLVTDSTGHKIHNARNKKFQKARYNTLSLFAHWVNGRHICAMSPVLSAVQSPEDVYRSDARQKRRVRDSLLRYAAYLDRNYDTVFVEANSGVALGKGQSAYTGSTRILVSVLRQRLGWDRVREVESFYNSQDCSQCGHRDKITWERRRGTKNQVCKCMSCGYIADRDVNAARNVLRKGLNSTM